MLGTFPGVSKEAGIWKQEMSNRWCLGRFASHVMTGTNRFEKALALAQCEPRAENLYPCKALKAGPKAGEAGPKRHAKARTF